MKLSLLAAGMTVAAALPSLAMAQADPACLRSNSNSNTQGTVLGAAGGALAGSALAGRHDRALGAVLGGVGGAIVGNRLANSRNDPCPEGYYRDPNYQPAYAPQPAYGAPAPAYGGDYGYGRDFWRGAPQSSWERVQWLQSRIERGRADGSLRPRDAAFAQRELDRTREYARMSRQRYGELRPEDRAYIDQRLNYVSRTIRWARRNG